MLDGDVIFSLSNWDQPIKDTLCCHILKSNKINRKWNVSNICKVYVKLQLTSSLGDGCNNATCTTVAHFVVSCEVSMVGGSTVQRLQNMRRPVSIQLNLLPVAMVSFITEHITYVKICKIMKLRKLEGISVLPLMNICIYNDL